MKNNKKIIVVIVLLLVISNVATFSLTNILTLKAGSRVALSRDELDNLVAFRDKYAKLDELSDYLSDNYYKSVDQEAMVNGAIKGVFSSLDDPYTVYMTEDEFDDYMEHATGEYSGIGIYVSIDEMGLISIISPIEGSPGYRAGLKSNDKIIKVNGVDVDESNYEEAINMMKGKSGSSVKVTISRKTESSVEEFDLEIVREEIEIDTVTTEVLDNNLGYVRIKMFDKNTGKDFKNHVEELLESNIEGLVIDLRNNPGGSLRECIEVCDYILGEQVIVSTKTRAGEVREFKSDSKKIDLPLAVLVNGNSASASEILTGAIQDSSSGTIIGTTTFGKGLVQTLEELRDGSGVKVTTSQYYTPNGDYIHSKGIKPHIVLELSEQVEGFSELDLENDNQLLKAIEVLNKER